MGTIQDRLKLVFYYTQICEMYQVRAVSIDKKSCHGRVFTVAGVEVAPQLVSGVENHYVTS